MRFLKYPNLPDSGVQLCALAAGQGYIARQLEQRGIETVELPPHPVLARPVAHHADLQLHDLGDGQVLLAPGCDSLARMLRELHFTVEESRPLEPFYPGDVPLCCFALGGVLYCNPAHTAPQILRAYPRVRPVRQGYARCSVCLVDHNSALTADAGLAAALEMEGVSVLRIRPGYIELPGYETGFIGGCAGLIAPGLLAFTGECAHHPDGGEIRAFCTARGVEIVSLSNGPLRDIGGILPLLQS